MNILRRFKKYPYQITGRTIKQRISGIYSKFFIGSWVAVVELQDYTHDEIKVFSDTITRKDVAIDIICTKIRYKLKAGVEDLYYSTLDDLELDDPVYGLQIFGTYDKIKKVNIGLIVDDLLKDFDKKRIIYLIKGEFIWGQ